MIMKSPMGKRLKSLGLQIRANLEIISRGFFVDALGVPSLTSSP